MWVWRPDALSVLRDKKVRKNLSRYFDVMKNDKHAGFMISKKLSANFFKDAPLPKLFKVHGRLTEEFSYLRNELDSRQKSFEKINNPERSYLDLKIEMANRILMNCQFCTRKCGFNRFVGELGFCNCGTKITVSTMFEHMGEEPELVPSGTIFTLGCTMKCLHCQNWSISQWYEKGEIFTPKELAKAVERLSGRGCRNINLVGGEPTPWLHQWLETFKHVEVNVPVIWNSNAYYSEETAKLLAGFIDVYLLDFKYGSNTCAEEISDAPNYWEASTRNLLYGKKWGELIIRVLVLPGHLECCTKVILNWIAKNLGTETRTNIMFQYRPEWRAHEIPEIRRRLTRREKELAVKLAKDAGLTNFIL